MPTPHITLYTGHGCDYCAQVRQYFKDQQLPIFEIPTDHNASAITTVRQLTGELLIPVTVIAVDGRSDIVIVGYDKQKLDKTLKDIL